MAKITMECLGQSDFGGGWTSYRITKSKGKLTLDDIVGTCRRYYGEGCRFVWQFMTRDEDGNGCDFGLDDFEGDAVEIEMVEEGCWCPVCGARLD